MLFNLRSFLSDPANVLIMLLLALPGRLLALSLHEFAHAWVANRCGDPTAKMLGRLTINPAKHLDLMGTLMMVLVGFGWAKPVPVNPRNYRKYRRDDLLVSIAGVTMNLIMFLLSMILMAAIVAVALGKVPRADLLSSHWATISRFAQNDETFILREIGSQSFTFRASELLEYLPALGSYILSGGMTLKMIDVLITPTLGAMAGYLYQMLGYFAITNLSLAIFNLLPVPPLDGYHVLNDLVLRRRQLFANPQTARIASFVLFALVLSGTLGEGLGYAVNGVIKGFGGIVTNVFRSMGLIG